MTEISNGIDAVLSVNYDKTGVIAATSAEKIQTIAVGFGAGVYDQTLFFPASTGRPVLYYAEL